MADFVEDRSKLFVPCDAWETQEVRRNSDVAIVSICAGRPVDTTQVRNYVKFEAALDDSRLFVLGEYPQGRKETI